jgi:carbon-monoxide dehydrogenase small subunit
MLVSARDLVLRLPQADERLIRVGLSGNLCRCTGYVGIVRAVQSVIEARRARDIASMPDGGRKILGPVGSGRSVHHGADRAERMPPLGSEQTSPEAASPVASNPDFIPATVLTQHFSVAHPPEQVFAMFDDIAAVAACLPGASLTAPPKPERVEGAIRVRIGPIAATFQGAARVERNPADMSGRIVGIGNDRRSRSSTQGEIRYRLVPIERGTRVDLSIGYTLTGLLAQVGRPGLVRDLAARLIAEFAGNLDRRLSGTSPGDAIAAELNGMAFGFSLLRAQVARWVGRFSSKRDGAT